MKPIICVLVLGAIVAVHSAPALLTQQYLLITPEAQLQLAPTLKLQKPILQPITQVTRVGNLKNGENKEILLYYPNTPLVQYPTVLPLRQNFASWDAFLDAIQDFFQLTEEEGKPEEPEAVMASDIKKDAQQSEKLEFENDAETISPAPAPPAPAPVPAPIPNFPVIPTLNGHRFYVIGGEPQFYGNFAGLNDPTNPLYAFQPILTKGRSVETEIEAGSDESVEVASSSDVGVKTLSEKILAQSEPRFQSKYPAALNEAETNSAAELEGKLKGFQQKESENESAGEKQSLKVSDDPSVARAGPEGIALAGKGGLAASYPFGTALVGKGGLAFSNPSATSIAGDFLDIDGKA